MVVFYFAFALAVSWLVLLVFLARSPRIAFLLDGSARARLHFAIVGGVLIQMFEIIRLPGIFIALFLLGKGDEIEVWLGLVAVIANTFLYGLVIYVLLGWWREFRQCDVD